LAIPVSRFIQVANVLRSFIRDSTASAPCWWRCATGSAGDPRPSLQERYPTHANYVARVTAAANSLVARRLLLPEDAAFLINAANAAAVP